MKPFQLDRAFVSLAPVQATAEESVTGTALDTAQYNARYAVANLITGTAGTSFNVTAWTCQESDDNTTYATVAAASGGTATSSSVGFVIPALVTANDGKVAARVTMDLANRKRYLRWLHSSDTTVVLGSLVELSQQDEGADANAERGTRVFAIVAS